MDIPPWTMDTHPLPHEGDLDRNIDRAKLFFLEMINIRLLFCIHFCVLDHSKSDWLPSIP